MRCNAMPPRQNGNDTCFKGHAWYVHSSHHRTMSHPHKECSIPTSGRKSEYSWSLNVFLRSFSLSHITTHIRIFTSNQIPSKGVIFSFCKTKLFECYAMLCCPIRFQMLMYALTIWFIHIFKAYFGNRQITSTYEFLYRIHKSLQLTP